LKSSIVIVSALLSLGGLSVVRAQEAPNRAPLRLTNIISSYPSPSPDGERVVFQSNRTGRWEIYVMNIDGSDLTRITDRAGDNVTPAWSPDGELIAFAASPGENSDIYLMKTDGSDLKRLTNHPGDDSHPHWSANGERIIFNSPRTTPDLEVEWTSQWHEIFSMKFDGTDLHQHTHHKAVCTYPSFSPDGTKIVYRKITNTPGFAWDLTGISRNSEVFLADADGSNEINLSNNAAFDGWPMWSPAGDRIVFVSNRAGPANVGHLYLVNVDGTGLQQITSGTWSYVQPAWSHDGSKLFAYQNQETADFEFGDVVVVDVPDADM
jgi:TolB protein